MLLNILQIHLYTPAAMMSFMLFMITLFDFSCNKKRGGLHLVFAAICFSFRPWYNEKGLSNRLKGCILTMRKKDKILMVALWIWFFFSSYFLAGMAQKISFILLLIAGIAFAMSLRR
jgi:hypothetical protein